MENYLYSQLVEESLKIDDSYDTEFIEDTVYISIDVAHLLRRGMPKNFSLMGSFAIELDLELDVQTEQQRWQDIFQKAKDILANRSIDLSEDDILTPYKVCNIIDDEESLGNMSFDELYSLYEFANDYELKDTYEQIETAIISKFPYAHFSDDELNEAMIEAKRNTDTNKEAGILTEMFRRTIYLYSVLKKDIMINKSWQNEDMSSIKLTHLMVCNLIDVLVGEDTPIYKDDTFSMGDVCFVEFDSPIKDQFIEAESWLIIEEEIVAKLRELGVDVKTDDDIDIEGVDLSLLSKGRLSFLMNLMLRDYKKYSESIIKIQEALNTK